MNANDGEEGERCNADIFATRTQRSFSALMDDAALLRPSKMRRRKPPGPISRAVLSGRRMGSDLRRLRGMDSGGVFEGRLQLVLPEQCHDAGPLIGGRTCRAFNKAAGRSLQPSGQPRRGALIAFRDPFADHSLLGFSGIGENGAGGGRARY